jgi:hypothetical protein
MVVHASINPKSDAYSYSIGELFFKISKPNSKEKNKFEIIVYGIHLMDKRTKEILHTWPIEEAPPEVEQSPEYNKLETDDAATQRARDMLDEPAIQATIIIKTLKQLAIFAIPFVVIFWFIQKIRKKKQRK